MKTTRRFAPCGRLLFAVLLLALSAFFTGCGKGGAAAQYHCPMHPTYVSDRPGDCPICGMRLVPVASGTSPTAATAAPASAATGPAPEPAYACPLHPQYTAKAPGVCDICGTELVAPAPKQEGGGESDAVSGMSPVSLTPDAIRLAGVQVATVSRERLTRSLRTVGRVVPDQSRIRHMHTKVSGWIEKLYVNFVGQPVVAGQPVLAIYSQSLLVAQDELLRARASGNTDLAAASRRRLELLDVAPSFIAELERGGKAVRAVPFAAPVSGYVTGKQAFEGMQVEPGTELFVLTDLSHVWVEADIYEYEAATISLGQPVVISVAYDAGLELVGKVAYIYPYLDQDSRTLRVRIDLDNKSGRLKPSMFVDVTFAVALEEQLVIPDAAVLDTGVRKVVFVEQDKNSFVPREVRVGLRAGDRVQVLSGVREGERVASRATFLLDSESRIRAAVDHQHAPAPEAGVTK